MVLKGFGAQSQAQDVHATPAAVAEEILERKLDDIATVLQSMGTDKSHLYDEVLEMVERSLFRIALRRSNNVRTAAAAYLGINRNTFQKKMVKLGVQNEPL